MADDLSAPLGRKRMTKGPPSALRLSAERIPLARIAFGLLVVIGLGIAARVVLVKDPTGGQPVAEVGVNAAHNGNTIAATVAASSSVTITAGPEMPASGAQVTMVGPDVPDGNPTKSSADFAANANAQGLYPGLLEETGHGGIPRVSSSGQTPFEAYATPSPTSATPGHKPLIAIVVTGLGLNIEGTNAAIETLPNPITLAFAPYGKGLTQAVSTARASGHEVLLEVPLEPFDYPESDPGPDTLLTGQAPRDNLEKLFTVMGKFGGYVGLINHMGARFTASTADFNPIMEELGSRGLGYLDDGSSNRSTAPQLATANNVPFGRADIDLDSDPAPTPIEAQLKALEDKATDKGQAIGIISALPVSVQTLTDWAKTAEQRGFTLVPVSALMQKPTT